VLLMVRGLNRGDTGAGWSASPGAVGAVQAFPGLGRSLLGTRARRRHRSDDAAATAKGPRDRRLALV